MKLARALSEAEAKKVQSFVLLAGLLTTLAIWTKLEDPVNLPKMFVLVLFAAMAIGLSTPALMSVRKLTSSNQRIGIGLIGLFATGLLISMIATDVKYTAIFGEYHRNNGALSSLAMASLMIIAVLVFNLRSSYRYLKFYAATGFILTAYGILQAVGRDPIGWVIDYNPIITTLGNPNFTSGFLGLSGIAILFLLLDSSHLELRIIYALGLLADLYILKRSGSIQGAFSFAVGASIIILVKLWLIKKRYGQLCLGFLAITSIPVLLGLLNIGPLASKIYQGTLRNRFDYWSAAVGMFNDHIIFGVGIDRFGEYYREYAPQDQLVREQVTNNAHSVYMQILATGGLITFIPYVLLISFITYFGFRALNSFAGRSKLQVSGILGVWIGNLLLNLVTIDNLGVGVWFWITGGVLLALNFSEDSAETKPLRPRNKIKFNQARTNEYKNTIFPLHHLAAITLTAISVFILAPQLGKSTNLMSLKSSIGAFASEENVAAIETSGSKVKYDSQYLIQLANLALRQGGLNEAKAIIAKINEIDSRSYYGKYFAAIVLENEGNFSQANSFRMQIEIIDPWNTKNMLQIVRNHLALKDFSSATATARKIHKIYPGIDEDIQAQELLSKYENS